MKNTLIAIALLALTWSSAGNPVAKQARSIRRALWEAGGGRSVRSDGWGWGVGGTYRHDNSWDLGTKVTYDKGNFGGYLSGNINSNGGWGVGAGFTYRFGRSAESFQDKGRFNVTLRADPCNFNTYDLNQDGVITTYEFQKIFGSEENTRNLFNALDITTVDGILERDEFEAMAERVIEECAPLSE